ncbi:MAG: LamG domain-containing protein [Phycisphaerales bacterium]
MHSVRAAVLVPIALSVTLASGAPPEFATSVSNSQPILWYRLGEPSGNFVNSGTLGPAFNAFATGTPTRAVPTPGGDTGIALARGAFLESFGVSPLTGNPTFSIEAVVNLADPGAASFWGPFLHWGDGGANRSGREVYFGIQASNNNRVYAGFYNGGIRTSDILSGNTWVHVVWTRQGGNNSEAGSSLYINGCLVATQRDPDLSPGFFSAANINVTPTTFRINEARDVLGNRYFTGILDEVALYNRILTAEEIEARGSIFRCAADRNCDGGVDGDDVIVFFNAWDQSLPEGDFTGDGGVDGDDVIAFFERWDFGC